MRKHRLPRLAAEWSPTVKTWLATNQTTGYPGCTRPVAPRQCCGPLATCDGRPAQTQSQFQSPSCPLQLRAPLRPGRRCAADSRTDQQASRALGAWTAWTDALADACGRTERRRAIRRRLRGARRRRRRQRRPRPEGCPRIDEVKFWAPSFSRSVAPWNLAVRG